MEDEESENEETGQMNGTHKKRVLVSTEAAELLQNAGEGSLGK